MNDARNVTPGLLAGLFAVARRDLLLAWKRPGDVLNPLFFFVMELEPPENGVVLGVFFCA